MSIVSNVVIVDGRPEVRAAVGTDFPNASQRWTLADALEDVDAVVIATPPESHFELAAEAIAAGKHVLVEKPMATSTAEATEMVQLAREAGVTLAAGHTFAHNAAVWKLKDIVDSGELGRLHYLDAARLNLGLYRNDVNVLWDLAAHDISITTALLCDVPDSVSAWGGRHTKRFDEDVAMLRMLFERKQIESTVRVSWLDPVKVRRTTIVGSEKMAVYDDMNEDERIKIFDHGRKQNGGLLGDPPTVRYRFGDVTAPRIDFSEPLRLELSDFIDCARTGRRPRADGHAGLTVVAVLEASDQSLRENGAPVPIHLPHLHEALAQAVA